MNILESLKEHLSPEDLAAFEESVKTLVEDKAKARAELMVEEETKRLEALAEEFTEKEVTARVEAEVQKLEEEYETKTKLFKETAATKLQEYADKYVTEQVNEAVAFEIEKLESENEQKMNKLEESIIDNFDKFLDLEITSKISDSLLESIAINEAYKPIIEGISKLFEANYTKLDVDTSKLVEVEKEKQTALEKKLEESYEGKMELKTKVDLLETKLLISEKTASLKESDKSKVKEIFEGKSYDEVSKKIDIFLEMLTENEKEETEVKTTINEDIFTTEEEVVINEEKIEEEKDERKIRLEKINQYLE